MESEEGVPLRLKIEINSREHISVMGLIARKFDVQSRWFSGSCSIPTYHLEELLGTKLRALYQRSKGRDLFDLWIASVKMPVDPKQIVRCFLKYMENEGHKISRAEFERNLLEKFDDASFPEDVIPLLVADNGFDFREAKDMVMNRLVPLIPGEPWQGRAQK